MMQIDPHRRPEPERKKRSWGTPFLVGVFLFLMFLIIQFPALMGDHRTKEERQAEYDRQAAKDNPKNYSVLTDDADELNPRDTLSYEVFTFLDYDYKVQVYAYDAPFDFVIVDDKDFEAYSKSDDRDSLVKSLHHMHYMPNVKKVDLADIRLESGAWRFVIIPSADNAQKIRVKVRIQSKRP